MQFSLRRRWEAALAVAAVLGATLLVQAVDVSPARADYGVMIQPASGKVTGLVNYRCATGSESHDGVDIYGQGGTPVVAPYGGTVTRAGWYSNYGYTVDISHGAGYTTRLAHLRVDSISVSVNQQVNQGDQVGLVGGTGSSVGEGLHLEIMRNGVNITNQGFACDQNVSRGNGIPMDFPGLASASAKRVMESSSANGWNQLAPGMSATNVSAIAVNSQKFLYTLNGGNVYESASSNGWATARVNTIAGASDVAAMAVGTEKLIYTIIGGQVYEASSNNGWKNLPTGITGASGLAVTSMNGVKYVYTLVGGTVWEAASNNGWKNLPMNIAAQEIAAMSMNGVKYVYTINNGVAYEAASNNGWKSLLMSAYISNVTNIAAMNMGGVKYVYTLVGGTVREAASNNGWNNLPTNKPGTQLSVLNVGGVKFFYTLV